MTPIVVVAAVIERDGAFLLTLRPDGTHLAGSLGVSRRQGARQRDACRSAATGDFRRARRGGHVGELVHTVTHAYPEKTVQLFFYRCDLEGEAKPMMGQEMRWVDRSEYSAAFSGSRP